MDKVAVFEHELGQISDPELREFGKDLLAFVPDAFFIKAASSTGKYHPKSSNIEGGLVNHTKSAFWIGVSLMKSMAMFSNVSTEDRDTVLMAILFHDSMKYPEGSRSKYTSFEHPVLVKELVKKCWRAKKYPENLMQKVSKMLKCVESHMGAWTVSKYSAIILPTPEGRLEKLVHLCDYIAGQVFCDYDPSRIPSFVENLKADGGS